MSPGPDVTPVGFAATDAPGAHLRRRRNPLWLVVAFALLLVGLGGIGWFVHEQVEGAPGRDEALAAGTVAALGSPPGQATRFAGPGGEHTVWLDLDGVRTSATRERIVAATVCDVLVGGGRSVRVRGSRQGSSVTIGDRATVGTFTASQGQVTISCAQQPFGPRRGRDVLRDEQSFFVTAGAPGAGLLAWLALFGGIGAIVLGVPSFGAWRAGHLRPS